ncbi:MAG TPA: tetratricopeptide repeat protein, partial [Candidatus Lambdaproteobacteria bacterium]|nr:tetratricopeptide repeat protein [Candidatus Lambdaproteobacteria bacterium]
MRRSNSLFYLIFTIILVFQVASGFAESRENVATVKTHSGSFPLPIPTLRLPSHPVTPLVTVPDAVFPELPDWHYSRFIPEDPSWLDSAGKFYKEGLIYLFRGDLNVAFKRFQSVTDNYPETPWFAPSLFWQAQILSKRKKYALAEKTLTFFLDSLKKGKSTESYIEYQNFSRYTLAWLALKQKKYNKALEIIEKNKEVISVKKIRIQLLFLKYLIHVQLKQSDLIFEVIDDLIQLFPYDFEHVVRLAEFYFVENRWQELADLVEAKAREQVFYNDPRMEHFLWLGVAAEMRLKHWNKAKKRLQSLEKFGVRSPDKLALAYLRLNLYTNQTESSWRNWFKIQDDIVREKALRELIHHAVKTEEFLFLIKKQPDLKSVTQYWREWQGELELIYAYLYLRQGQIKKAKQFLLWAQNNLKQESNQVPLIVKEESLYLGTVIELLLKDHQKALQHLKQLLAEYAGSERQSDYYFWYGVLLYELEKSYLQTIMAMRQVDREGERDDDRLFLLGKVNHDQQKWRAVISAFAKLQKLHPGSQFLEEGLYLQAQAYFELKQYNSGLEILNELQNTFGQLKKAVRAVHLRVQILVAMQRYEQADDVLQRMIEESSDFSLIKLRVEVLKYIKDPRRILSVTGVGLELSTNKDQGFLYFHRANALFDTKKYEEANTYYTLALKNPPKDTRRVINYRILKIQYELGRIPELLQGADLFLKVSRDDFYSYEILHMLSNYFLEKKQREKAFSYLKQLVANYKKSVRKVELAPEKRLEQIVLIGQLYNELTNYELAERWLNQALKSMETVEEGRKKWQLHIFKEKGFALYKLGKHRQALAASLKVLYLDRSLSNQQRYDLNLRIASSY